MRFMTMYRRVFLWVIEHSTHYEVYISPSQYTWLSGYLISHHDALFAQWEHQMTHLRKLEYLLLYFGATWFSPSIEILYDWPIIVDWCSWHVTYKPFWCCTKILIVNLDVCMYACTVYVKIRCCKCYTIFPFPLIENQFSIKRKFSIKRTILTITLHGFPCGLVVRIQRSHRCGRGSIPRMGDFFLEWE